MVQLPWGLRSYALLARAPWAEAARLIALFPVGAVVVRTAGCAVNGMWGRDLDRMVTHNAGRSLAPVEFAGFLATLAQEDGP